MQTNSNVLTYAAENTLGWYKSENNAFPFIQMYDYVIGVLQRLSPLHSCIKHMLVDYIVDLNHNTNGNMCVIITVIMRYVQVDKFVTHVLVINAVFAKKYRWAFRI